MTAAERLRQLADSLPDGAAVTLPAVTIREWLADDTPATTPAPVPTDPPCTWRERLWTVPPDTRLGVRELAEALDRSPDWVYRAASSKNATKHGRDPLPCQKFDGELVFRAGDVRHWLDRSELTVNPPPRRLRTA